MSRQLPEELRQLIEERKKTNPELFEKYGDPTDENDPRFWTPSTRAEKGLSLEDRVKYLELDTETSFLAFGPVVQWVMRKQQEEMAEELRKDPIAFLRKAIESGADPTELLGSLSGIASYGPDDENGTAYAGSTEGLAPDTLVDTIQGKIRADQIPGYRNEPSWRPSIDWVDANCTCENHQRQRAAASSGELDGGFGNEDPPNGMYL